MRLKKTAVAASAVAALALVAACGGGGGGNAGGTQQSYQGGGGAGAGKNADAEGPAAVPSDAATGGTMNVVTWAAPATLDPTRTYYTDSGEIMNLVTRALTQYVYDPKTKDMVLEPDMATDLGQVSKDGLTWTFTLKDGLKYEDGTDVKAEDVAYAIKRSFAIDTLPDGPTYQLTFFKDGDIYKGPFASKAQLKKMDGYKSDWYSGDDYKGVETSGNKIIIHLAKPFPDLDYYASFPVFTAIPESKDTDPTAYEQHPLATGPYKFADYKPGAELKLVKNDQWDPNTDPGRIQSVDGWDFKFSQNQAKDENAILGDKGNAQTTVSYDNALPQNYKQAATNAPDQLTSGTSPCTYFWYIDMKKITDKRVREALAWAYPYQDAWKAAGYIVGVTRQPGTSLLPPGTAGRVEYQYPEGQDGQTTDPAKSKALLKEAGAMGFKIQFSYKTDVPESVAAKDAIVKGLKAGGFDPQPVASTSAKERDLQSDNDAPLNIRSSGWCSDWPTGGSWFPAIFDGRLVGQAGMPNKSNFKVAAADKKQDQILQMSPDKSAAAWGEFDKWMQTTYMPVVNVGYSGTAMLHGTKVGGMYNDSTKGMPTFSTMYIKQ